MEGRPQVQGTMWARNRESPPQVRKLELPPPPLWATGGPYLQLQVGVNLWPQQAEEVGRSGELKP